MLTLMAIFFMAAIFVWVIRICGWLIGGLFKLVFWLLPAVIALVIVGTFAGLLVYVLPIGIVLLLGAFVASLFGGVSHGAQC